MVESGRTYKSEVSETANETNFGRRHEALSGFTFLPSVSRTSWRSACKRHKPLLTVPFAAHMAVSTRYFQNVIFLIIVLPQMDASQSSYASV